MNNVFEDYIGTGLTFYNAREVFFGKITDNKTKTSINTKVREREREREGWREGEGEREREKERERKLTFFLPNCAVKNHLK